MFYRFQNLYAVSVNRGKKKLIAIPAAFSSVDHTFRRYGIMAELYTPTAAGDQPHRDLGKTISGER